MSSLARSGLVALLGAATWLFAPAALAQEGKALGSKGSFVLSLEHLGGYSYTRFKVDSPLGGDSESLDNHQIGLFTPFIGPFGAHARLGFHYFVAPPISLGGIASYSDNDYFGTFTLIGIRVGAAIPMSDSTSIWLRGGISYARTKLELGSSETTYSAFVPGGEALFAFKPLDHFGFLAGGLFETTVGAKYESESQLGSNEADYEQMEIALSLGVFLEL